VWRRAGPRDALHWLCGSPRPWWLAGGWALDRFLGVQTRAHGDLDLGCLRRDLAPIRSALPGWECFETSGGRLRPLAEEEAPANDIHSRWSRPEEVQQWHLEILLDQADGEDWIFRRDPSIRLQLRDLTWRDEDTLSILRPEVQLLYQAKRPRPRDEYDFARTVPRLDVPTRCWLAAALECAQPGHSWRARL